jgi:hypothetical protein
MEWEKTTLIVMADGRPRSLSDIAVRDETKEMRPDARPQARKNRRRIRWNTLRIFLNRERRRWSRIVRRSRTVNIGQAPDPSRRDRATYNAQNCTYQYEPGTRRAIPKKETIWLATTSSQGLVWL